MINYVYTLGSSTPSQIQDGRFIRTLARKIGDMICDQVRILYLLILRILRIQLILYHTLDIVSKNRINFK